MIENINIASIHIPNIIKSAKFYTTATEVQRSNTRDMYQPSIVFYNSLLFYVELFLNEGIAIDCDYFNFIPLTHDEIVMLIYHANQFDTLMTGKLSTNSLRVKYTP